MHALTWMKQSSVDILSTEQHEMYFEIQMTNILKDAKLHDMYTSVTDPSIENSYYL